MPRPDVAPRPICRYHNVTPHGCLAGNKCRYLHADSATQKYTPYEENKTCKFYAQGYCKRGNECWYKHVDAADAGPALASTSTSTSTPAGSTQGSPNTEKQTDGGCPATTAPRVFDASCGICFEEKPALYGLLSRCSHAFCLTCIRQWRDPKGKSPDMTDAGIHKTCPICRTKTKFIVPSSRFYPQDDPRKAEVLKKFKQSTARVSCRYFAMSDPKKRFCPFGRDCFYQHANADGTPYEFSYGVDSRNRHHPHRVCVSYRSVCGDPGGISFGGEKRWQDRETEQLLTLYTPMLEFFHDWVEQNVEGGSVDEESFEF